MGESTPSPRTAAVFFDVDGTLIKSTIVHYYAYFMRRRMHPVLYKCWYAALLMKGVYYLALDKIDRSRFNVVFYRNYRGLPVDQIRSYVADCHRDYILPHMFVEAKACVDAHRSAGRTLVLVTGSIDFILEPLAAELGVHHVIAPTLLESNGRFTGELDGRPVGEEEKARRMLAFAQAHDIDLSESYAYGDSTADLPMLEIVGHPYVVNPDKNLASIAAARGWDRLHWTLPLSKENSAHEGAAFS